MVHFVASGIPAPRHRRSGPSPRRRRRVDIGRDRLERVGRHAAAIWAACACDNGGTSRVLTRPATGCLAMTVRWNRPHRISRRIRLMSFTARTVPPRCRSPSIVPNVRCTRRARCARRDRLCAARNTISSGQPERRSVMLQIEQRLAPDGSHRTEIVEPQTSFVDEPRAAEHRFASRACGGHAPRRAMRLPITRSASPCSTYAVTSGSASGSSDASQSMKQTMSSVAACSPAQQAEPKPLRGSSIDDRAVRRSEFGRPIGRPVVDDDRPVPAGIRPSTHGTAAASFERRQDHVRHSGDRTGLARLGEMAHDQHTQAADGTRSRGVGAVPARRSSSCTASPSLQRHSTPSPNDSSRRMK